MRVGWSEEAGLRRFKDLVHSGRAVAAASMQHLECSTKYIDNVNPNKP